MTDKLTRQNTHLICPCGEGPKFTKALEWQIPVVNLQWLFDTVTTASIPNVEDYCVRKQSTMDLDIPPMADITNNGAVPSSSRSNHSSSGSENKRTSPTKGPDSHTIDAADEWIPTDLLFDKPQPATLSSPARKLSNLAIHSSPVTPSRLSRQPTELIPTRSRDPSPSKGRQRTASETERVPSSATPSPLKMPSINRNSAASMARASADTTPTISEGSAAAIKDALVSLLGKRTSSEDHGQHNGSSTEKHPRATKRSKPPPRSKSSRAFSRTGSASEVAMGRTGSSLTSLSATEYPLSESFETPPEFRLGNTDEEDDSMRVTYEDPSQRDAEQKLQKLFEDAARTAETQQEHGVGERLPGVEGALINS